MVYESQRRRSTECASLPILPTAHSVNRHYAPALLPNRLHALFHSMTMGEAYARSFGAGFTNAYQVLLQLLTLT